MKFQFLPHYFKYIGLILYFSFGLGSGLQAFINGFYGLPEDIKTLGIHPIFFSEKFDLIQYFGIFIYAFSKDKIIDEFMIYRRLESMYITFLASLVFIFLRLLFNIDWQIDASYFFETQILLFLIINKCRKHFSLSSF